MTSSLSYFRLNNHNINSGMRGNVNVYSVSVQKVLLFEEDIFNLQIKVAVTQECSIERDLFKIKLSGLLFWHGSRLAKELVVKHTPTD